jgi:Tol biopolymer transport system component
VLDDLSTPVSFSPDGKQIVFAHSDIGEKQNPQLVIANSDGTGRHTIVERAAMAANGSAPSWSGDGGLIAVAQYELTKEGLSNVLVFTPDGKLVKSFAFHFLVDGIAWLPDSSGMFLEYRSPETSFRKQIKFQPYPSGNLQNITNDLNEYRNITVTTDGKTLATIQEQKASALYVGATPAHWPGEVKLNPGPLTPGQAEGAWAQWGIDGKIYYGDEAFHSYRMNPDGSSRSRVPDRDTNAAYGTSCGPHAVVFATLRNNNLSLFRQDLTTREVKQLTSERDAEYPVCSSDGKTVYYNDFFEGPSIKKMSTNGQSSASVYAGAAAYASLSPDGRRIAFFQFSSAEGEHKNLLVVQEN